jgi:two-component system, NarL family, response regulator NreC
MGHNWKSISFYLTLLKKAANIHEMIKLAILDDHEIFLRGLEKLLKVNSDIETTATFLDGSSLLQTLPTLDLDILILDIQIPDFEPENLLKKIRLIKSDLPILYLTMFRGSRLLRKLEKQQVQGYILKDAAIEELINAIKLVASGDRYFSSEVFDINDIPERNTVTTPTNKLVELLSPREYEILTLVCQEYSSPEIGEKLFLSTGTVDTHRRNILVKLGVNNTVGMVKFALQNGILDEIN